MSLFGALSTGVSGMKAQGTAISIISDNIANINTTGYKSADANFSTLVTANSSSGYSPGGVLASAKKLFDQQGLIQSTGISTDLAISGGGFFVVNESSDANGDFLYTRAGSFRKDDRGNFVNGSGYTLMGWPLDGDSRLPGEAGNLNTTSSALLESLKPVNIKSISGVASQTTTVSLGINLNAAQPILQGSGDDIKFLTTSLENKNNGADDIIIPSPTSGTGIAAGDQFTVRAAGAAFSFTYGGFDISKAVTGGILGASTASQIFSNGNTGTSFSIGTTSMAPVTFTYTPTSPNVQLGQFNNLYTLASAIDQVNGLSARVVNNQLYLSPENATEAMTFTDIGNITTSLQASTLSPILGATSATTAFSNALAGDGLSIEVMDDTTGTTTTHNLFYGTDFTDMTTLAAAIDALSSDFNPGTLSSSGIVLTPAAGKSIISVRDNNAGGGTSNFASALGILGTSWSKALQVADTPAQNNRFSTLQGLADLVNLNDGIAANILNPLDSSTLHLYTKDPLGTIDFIENGSNSGSLLTEFGMVSNPSVYVTGVSTVGPLGPAYDPTGSSAGNMSSGAVQEHYSRNVRMFDSLGTGHDFQVNFLKIGQNTWAVESYALDKNDIVSTRTDGQIASGVAVFNGDGSLRSISSTLTQPIDIVWSNGAAPNSVTFDYGTAGQIKGTPGATQIGLTDGLKQFDSDYNVEFVDQNGVAAGLLSAVNIDKDGYVIANFSNGEARRIFKLPIADFANPNGLETRTGNVYAESQFSGNFNLREAGKGGMGVINGASLEASNVEIADELTKMIVAQRGYQASSKIISTVNDLLDQLNKIF
ncbi:MAG: flagellar hook-basal body complex protein [Alphaproteobacteria bacterium]|nr:flagellar hook-basal body complex protein [Alphaproteobacteria bacterium]